MALHCSSSLQSWKPQRDSAELDSKHFHSPLQCSVWRSSRPTLPPAVHWARGSSYGLDNSAAEGPLYAEQEVRLALCIHSHISCHLVLLAFHFPPSNVFETVLSLSLSKNTFFFYSKKKKHVESCHNNFTSAAIFHICTKLLDVTCWNKNVTTHFTSMFFSSSMTLSTYWTFNSS